MISYKTVKWVYVYIAFTKEIVSNQKCQKINIENHACACKTRPTHTTNAIGYNKQPISGLVKLNARKYVQVVRLYELYTANGS